MSWFIDHLKDLKDKSAIVDSFGEFSYSDLVAQIQSYKDSLDQMFSDGQVVAIHSDYNFYSVALFFALFEKKSIIIPIVSTNPEEVEKRLNVVNPHIIIKFKLNELVFDVLSNEYSIETI
jgi:long-subunit acyl-CoA synthetase (AMP-forming)